MLVFGDHVRVGDPRTELAELALTLGAVRDRPPGLARHAALVSVFIDASELAQGLADAELATTGIDARSATGERVMMLLVALARAIETSWTSGFRRLPRLPLDRVTTLSADALPETIRMRRAEGYAFYAVYPEAYLMAARAAAAHAAGPRHVIGIRSIGAGLAAIVAAATGSPRPATVRPRGNPSRRELKVDPGLSAEWSSSSRARIAVVDEGPGLSGSSFGAVLDLLEDRGVSTERIECFPSHHGELGAAASPRHRERWSQVRRHVVDVRALLVHPTTPEHDLARWIAELVGPLTAPLEDLSAGAWRARRFSDEARWPASVTYQERRKLLARTRSAMWLARFVGLGRDGEHALARARELHAVGMTPEVAGLCHGFLIERWREDTRPLDLGGFDRERLVDHVGRYLGFRARAFRADRDRGASLVKLVEMTRHNAALALGSQMRSAIDRWDASPSRLDARTRRIEIDGRLHAWEWQVARDGTLVKTDALDHHASHDLVGCQDVTWDLAGAAIELGLSGAEEQRLASIVGTRSGHAPDPELLRLMRPCYLAFQLGRHELAIAGADPGEAVRLRAAADRYGLLLRASFR